MKYSVIIPAWGDTPHIARAIGSVPERAEIEVICVGPAEEHPDSLLSARIAGIARAKGEYVLFLDADDELEVGAIDTLSRESKGADIVCGAMVRLSRTGRALYRPYDPIGPSDSHNSLAAKLIARKLLDDLVVDFSIRNGEDLLLIEQIFARAKSVRTTDAVVYRYYDNASSMTHKEHPRDKAADLLKVDEVLTRVLDPIRYAPQHNRIVRDALLLLLRARAFRSPLRRMAIKRLTERASADIRHGFIKRLALFLFA